MTTTKLALAQVHTTAEHSAMIEFQSGSRAHVTKRVARVDGAVTSVAYEVTALGEPGGNNERLAVVLHLTHDDMLSLEVMVRRIIVTDKDGQGGDTAR